MATSHTILAVDVTALAEHVQGQVDWCEARAAETDDTSGGRSYWRGAVSAHRALLATLIGLNEPETASASAFVR